MAARRTFAKRFEPWYPKAVEVLGDDWDRLVAFFDLPAQHWRYLRTTNVVESPVAAVRILTVAEKRFQELNVSQSH